MNFFLLSCLTFSIVCGIADKYGGAFLVNTEINQDQMKPQITGLSGGKYVITWQSLFQDGDSWGVFRQMYSERSKKYKGEEMVNIITDSQQAAPQVCSLPEGEYVIVWENYNHEDDPTSYGIFGQRYNKYGGKIGEDEFIINTETTNSQNQPTVASLSDGRFVVVWNSMLQDNYLSGVYGQIINADGSRTLTEFRVNSEVQNDQMTASVAGLDNGRFIVVWQSLEQDGDQWGIYGQLFQSTGGEEGLEFLVNTVTDGNQLDPQVTALSDGRFVVTWESDHETSYNIYAKIYNSHASIYKDDFQVNSQSLGNQKHASVAALSEGKFIIVWDSDYETKCGIFLQVFNADGSKLGGEKSVASSNTQCKHTYPSVGNLTNGDFIVAYENFGDDDDLHGIYAQYYSMNGIPFTLPLLTLYVIIGSCSGIVFIIVLFIFLYIYKRRSKLEKTKQKERKKKHHRHKERKHKKKHKKVEKVDFYPKKVIVPAVVTYKIPDNDPPSDTQAETYEINSNLAPAPIPHTPHTDSDPFPDENKSDDIPNNIPDLNSDKATPESPLGLSHPIPPPVTPSISTISVDPNAPVTPGKIFDGPLKQRVLVEKFYTGSEAVEKSKLIVKKKSKKHHHKHKHGHHAHKKKKSPPPEKYKIDDTDDEEEDNELNTTQKNIKGEFTQSEINELAQSSSEDEDDN